MKKADRDLLRILNRRDLKLKRTVMTINEGLRPNSDGSVVFSDQTFQAITELRKLYADMREEIADVEGGGNAQQGLVSAFTQVGSAWGDIAAAAKIGYSYEQADAFRNISKKMDRAVEKIARIRKGLKK